MKVSICVPIYGAEQYIEKCVRSLFEQTYDDIEYVFVDDCSPDKSIEILKLVLNEYPRRKEAVKIVSHPQNEGLAVARNTAIEYSDGYFLYHVDADDYIEKDAIASLIKTQLETDADIVTGRFFINEQDFDPRFIEPIYKTKDEMLTSILNNVWHHELCNRLIRKSLYVEHNIKALPHVNLCEDWQVVPRLVYFAKKCITIEKFTYHYVTNKKSLTRLNSNWEKEKDGYLQEHLSLKVLLNFFRDTKYEKAINTLFLIRQSDNVDLSIRHRDKKFFLWCRENILAIPSQYHGVISKTKLFFIKRGFHMMCLFIHLHDVKKNYLIFLRNSFGK